MTPGRHRLVRAALAWILVLAGHAAGTSTAVAEPPPPEPAAPRETSYRPPLGAGTLVEPFRRPAAPWGPGHRGVDLAAVAGTPVLAPADGVVTFAGTVVDRGVLTITHPDGLRSSLEPVIPGLGPGTRVTAGDEVAVVGTGGHCGRVRTGCLHWGVRRSEVYLDPLALLAAAEPVVLLPVLGPRAPR